MGRERNREKGIFRNREKQTVMKKASESRSAPFSNLTVKIQSHITFRS